MKKILFLFVITFNLGAVLNPHFLELQTLQKIKQKDQFKGNQRDWPSHLDSSKVIKKRNNTVFDPSDCSYLSVVSDSSSDIHPKN